jgi:uncharacterized repeat protein (TIGR03803 family)
MKQLYSLIMLFVTISQFTSAQGIYQMWGINPDGGTEDNGVIFSTKHDGTGYTIKKNFTVTNPGRADQFNKPTVYNNKFYCLLTYGGLASSGIIAEFDPSTNAWVKKVDLYTIGGTYSQSALLLYNNKLYGVARGGVNDEGMIFEFNPVNNALVKIYDFTEATGGSPVNSLTLYNNKFYGLGNSGGVYGDGMLFEFDPVTLTYTKKADMRASTVGRLPYNTLVVYANKLWGTTAYGALANYGALFSFDPATNIFSKKVDLDPAGLGHHYGTLTVLNNKLYGVASHSSTDPRGAIFEYNPATNILTKKLDVDDSRPSGSIEFSVYNNKLYGASPGGGAFEGGAIFSYDPASNQLQSHIDLVGDIGQSAESSMTLYNNRFYGFTHAGGYYNTGTLFTYSPDENSYVSLVHLGGQQLLVPEGPVMYYNNKIYGTATYGGDNQDGGIYEYDIATGIFTTKVSMLMATGQISNQGGFTLLNNKFYGGTRLGGANQVGALYEYDPATNQYTKRHDFAVATGGYPYSQLSVYNGKLYGACSMGSGNGMGNIFEYNPATNTYAERVILDQAKGGNPRGNFIWYNNRFFGTCSGAGANSAGTIFEYNPAANSFIKKYDFDNVNGAIPWGGLTAHNDQLYGLTFGGGMSDSGVLFSYNPLTATLSKKLDMTSSTGVWGSKRMTLLNNKLYGMTNLGGTNDEGVLFQFDPATDIYTKRFEFTQTSGGRGVSNELTPVPAPVAPGSPNSCINTQTININAANANEWIAFTDGEGRAVAEINANGNILGNTAVRFYVNGGNIRQDEGGRFYLDRNITITSVNVPNSPVSIRLYIRKREFDDLKATAGSGVAQPTDLALFKNSDFCSGTVVAPTTKLSTLAGEWGYDYVYTAAVTAFSSFYFASNTHFALPVHILSFEGTVLSTGNKLDWKASCTNDVSFTIERSTDRVNFTVIGLVNAQQQDCNQPFYFNDESVTTQRYYYRLQMKEDNGAVSFSKVVVLDRSVDTKTVAQFFPNPVSDNTAQLKVSTTQNGTAIITIIDGEGRKISMARVTVTSGINVIPIKTAGLPAGVYLLLYEEGKIKQTIRFVRQ